MQAAACVGRIVSPIRWWLRRIVAACSPRIAAMPQIAFRKCEMKTRYRSVSRKGRTYVVQASGVISKVENMSNFSTTLGAQGAIEAARPAAPSFWQRVYKALIAARQDQARREVERYYSTLGPDQLKDLGYPTSADHR